MGVSSPGIASIVLDTSEDTITPSQQCPKPLLDFWRHDIVYALNSARARNGSTKLRPFVRNLIAAWDFRKYGFEHRKDA